MALSYYTLSLPKCFSPPSSTNLIKHRSLISKYNNNVLANFVYRAPHLATKRAASYSPLTLKCLKLDVQPVVNGKKVVIIDGLQPAILTPPENLSRNDFPSDFLFGASTSAIQTEGNGKEGGRGPSTWDFMIGEKAGRNAVDSYNMYKHDVELLKNMSMNSYRFSIAWPRILPQGDGEINEEGIDFYNRFINELKANHIEPVVTLFHFDLPAELQKKYNGFLNSQIIEDFKNYADICFTKFGDRVKYWSTINEPYVFGSYGYKIGLPKFFGEENPRSHPLDPYIATHNIILAHAAAAKVYHEKELGGSIGISLPCKWFEPYSQDPKDIAAAQRHLDYMLGWYMDPFVKGDYPATMRESIKGLPEFTEEEKGLLKESCDYIGVNYYTARYVKHSCIVDGQEGYIYDKYEEDIEDINGNVIGKKAEGQEGIYVNPVGLKNLLVYIHNKYKVPELYVTENGFPAKPYITGSVQNSIKQGKFQELEAAIFDDYRIKHVEDHLIAVREAKKQGAKVKGYFVWTLMDNMEVGAGYDCRFGLNYVDYYDDCKRYPKKSAYWFASFLGGDLSKKDATQN